MIVGRVIGNVVSVIKDPSYEGFKLKVVQEINIDGSDAEKFFISADSHRHRARRDSHGNLWDFFKGNKRDL